VLEALVLLRRLDVAVNGHFALQTQDWATYWAPVRNLANRQIDCAVDALQAVWQDYIQSGFETALRREYCFRYFSLLDLVLSAHRESRCSPSWSTALQAVVGFECFGLSAPALGGDVLAAGTTTVRNPVYLLTKLKWPDVPDDTRFLPLIGVGDEAPASLFFHYRQYWPSRDSPIALLVYLPTSQAHRPPSLRLVDSLARTVGSGADPYVKERAERLWKRILQPIVHATHPNPSRSIGLELVDVGAGTGALTAALCRKLLSWGRAAGFSPRLRLWFVDVCLSDPARFFRAAQLRGSVDSLMFLGDDYRGWLGRPRPLPRSSGLRVALVSKVFDVQSHSSICDIRTNVLPSRVADMETIKEGRHLPKHCLAREGSGPEALMVSYSRIALAQGRTFAQASLSEFFRALRLASGVGEDKEVEEDGVCLALRAFDPGCLVASDGASVLGRLLEHCDHLIVEDADLRPEDLVEHLRIFSLHTMTACDMTKAMGLTGNYAYVLWPREGEEPQLGGEQLW